MARLAAPVVLVQVGLMAMGVVDTIMVGRVSAVALAAAALAILAPPAGFLAVGACLFLIGAGRREGTRKYEGLRILR